MSAKGTDSSTQWLLACGPIGAFGFILVFLIAGVIRPNYSPMYHHVSSLSLGDGGWVQISNFVVTGALMVACALGLRRSLASGLGATWGPLLIVAFGLGLIGAGVFVADAAFGYPPGAPAGVPTSHTVHGTLHNVVSIVVFASLTAACFVFGRRFLQQPGNRAWALYSFSTGVAVPAFIIASSVALFNDGPAGLFQRLSVASGWVWVGLLAMRTMEGLRRHPMGRDTSAATGSLGI